MSHDLRVMRLVVEAYASGADGWEIQESLSRLCRQDLVASLEKVVVSAGLKDEWLSIDSLVVDLGTVGLPDLMEAFQGQVRIALDEARALATARLSPASGAELKRTPDDSGEAGRPDAPKQISERASVANKTRKPEREPSIEHGPDLGNKDLGEKSPDAAVIGGKRPQQFQAQAAVVGEASAEYLPAWRRPEELDLAVVSDFLVNGTLPWWFEPGGESISEVLARVVASSDRSCKSLNQLLAASVNTRRRLVLQISDRLLGEIVGRLVAVRHGDKQNVPASPFGELAADARLEAVEELFASQSTPFNELLPFEPIAPSMAGTKTPTATPNTEPPVLVEVTPDIADQSEVFEPLWLANAGLVLLGPFLPSFFDELGLLKDGRFQHDEAAVRATHLMQAAATGERSFYEHELALNKILCGIPLARPLPREVNITDREVSEGEKMLQAVISHWSVLKRTSIGTLRDTFLRRRGSLVSSEGEWLVRVEREAFDHVLDAVPWSFNTIRMSWMDRILRVEW